MKVTFVGYGTMAKAIAHGLIKDSNYTLSAAAPSLTKDLKKAIKTYPDNTEAVKKADLIILAVKPLHISLILKEIKPYIPDSCLLISVAAGLSLSWFSPHCKKDQPIIRAMPNTPASIGYAATPLFANAYTCDEQKQQAEQIFSKIGFCSWVNKEEHIDALTALSGSGPAYIFSFIEAMVHAGIALGLDETTAHKYVLQTMDGALKLAQANHASISELRTQVTSPGGTTAAALDILHSSLQELMLLSLRAAQNRAQELNQII